MAEGFLSSKVVKIGTFSEWAACSTSGEEIGVDRDQIASFHFETLYGAIRDRGNPVRPLQGTPQVGEPAQVPTQQMRDALLNMIVYQGDTNRPASSSSATCSKPPQPTGTVAPSHV